MDFGGDKWVRIYVDSSGMSATDNYRFELERMDNGKIKYRKISNLFGAGGMMTMMGMMPKEDPWTELSDEISEKLDRLPILEMAVVPEQKTNTMGNQTGQMANMSDREVRFFKVTYGEGRIEYKVWDYELAKKLIALLGIVC